MNEKVLLVHNRYQKAGGEDQVFAAETALLRRYGHKVFQYIEDNQRIEGMGYFSLASQTIWSRRTRSKLIEMLHDIKPGIVHFHNTFPLISPSAYSACQKEGVPVVQTLHNYRLLCPSATFFRHDRVCEGCLGKTLPWPGVLHACYRGSRMQSAVVAMMLTTHKWLKTWRDQVDCYVTLTEFARRKFINAGFPPHKLSTKPNFLYPDPGMSNNQGHYALFVGRLSPEKGLRTLIDAWQHVPEIPLKIVGDGPLMCEIQRYIETRQLEQVEILGRHERQKVIEAMKGARFLVFPSECYEGFPVTIVEAFACGIPVIASRLGSVTEIVGDGRTGIKFCPGAPEDLAAKGQWAWTHVKETQAMKYEARAEYEKKYTAERNYKMLMDIYDMARRGGDH
jgi:glycosyltransferase involved in cell wall biosynthesis